MKRCSYCGYYNQCRDHVVPCSLQRVYKNFNPKETTPCCEECNTLAGDYPATSIIHKAEYLLRKYKDILKKDKTATWTEEELNELDHSLKSLIIARVQRKSLIQQKIKNLELVACGVDAIPIV